MVLDIKIKHWYPIIKVIETVKKFCIENNYQEILEIGPGKIQFPLANKFIGCNEKISNYIALDLDTTSLPFNNKEIDFIYSRHTMEDIQNPDFSLSEIFRVSKAGYIETPSILAEITKNIDCYDNANTYCGYIHHRYVVWSDIENSTIYFLPKYSCILDNLEYDNTEIIEYLNSSPIYWNNYFIWKNETPNIVMYKNGVNMGVKYNFVEDYVKILNSGISQYLKNTKYFMDNYMINV
jgi:hypothetical protein